VDLIDIADELVARLARIRVGAPVTHVYNPLVYARGPHLQYLTRYGRGRKQVVLVGMNPGPWGMVQTGVPFGEVNLVRDWLGIEAPVGKPNREHPRRPVLGFDCHRSEVSGQRLGGWARDSFGTPGRFFRRFFIANYCPLAFFDEYGRNITPDKVPTRDKQRIASACDAALRRTAEALRPEFVVGVGGFAESRARTALAGVDVTIGRILHPSPASPAANKNWAGKVRRQLEALGVAVP
jgi:single-strand selective monofunctional uracil DNA glycosylase